jgi:hypothetical protein
VGAILATLLLFVGPASAAGIRGCIDNDDFIDLAGDDAVMMEINLSGALLSALSRIDPELHQLVTGLKSIQAVILDLSSGGESAELDEALVARARRLASATDKSLRGRGWERIARVRDGGDEIKVLVLNDDEVINGLVVMVLDKDDGQLVFANICGTLDLAAIQAIGEGFDIPGLDQIDAP